MILRNRAFFVFLTGVSAALIGCGGGGGGSSPTPVHATATPTASAPTATPTATPSHAPTATPTPVPTATPTPIATANAPTVYVGSASITQTYYGSSPNPEATYSVTIERGVTDDGIVPFGTNPATHEITAVDENVQPGLTVTVTTDTYFTPATTGTIYEYGYKSSDTTGQNILDTITGLGSSNGQVDQLPETSGASWSNDGANTLAESEADGFTVARTTAAGGSYTETDTTPQSSQVTPTPSPLIATAVANANGSGSYSFYYLGAQFGLSTFNYAAPSGGNVTVSVDLSPAAAAFVGGNNFSYTLPAWFATPLYAENVVDNGPQTVPASCNVPATYGAIGYQIVRQVTNADPIFGTIETSTDTDYNVNDFTVCSVFSSTVKTYYDFTGQSGESPLGIGFANSTTPLEIQTTTSTIGLQKTDVSTAIVRRREIARMQAAGTSFRVAMERAQLERRHKAFLHLRTLILGRLHR